MRSSPRKLLGETDLYTAAINGLSRRAYSVYEMRTYLERRAEDKESVPPHSRSPQAAKASRRRTLRPAICASARRNTQAGAFRIARDLRARGVPDRHIEAALAERAAESDEGESCDRLARASNLGADRSMSAVQLRSTTACSAPVSHADTIPPSSDSAARSARAASM